MSQKFKCVQVHWRDDAHVDRTTYVTLTSVEDRVAELQPKVFDEAVGWAFELVTGFSPNRIIDYSPTELYDQHGRVWQDEVEEAPSKRIDSQFVQIVTVTDPVTGNPVEVEIRRLASGAMLGIDGSFLEHDVGPVYSPYDPSYQVVIPNDEPPNRGWVKEHNRDTWHYCGPEGAVSPFCGGKSIPGSPLISSNPPYSQCCLQCVQLVGHPSQEPKDA